jgi:hypothetical protein
MSLGDPARRLAYLRFQNAGIGATSSLPRVPVVLHPPFAGLHQCKPSADLCPGKPPEGQLDGDKGNEGGRGFGKVLEVLSGTPVSSEPGKVRSSTQRRGRTTKTKRGCADDLLAGGAGSSWSRGHGRRSSTASAL